jgi:hypothetical protein
MKNTMRFLFFEELVLKTDSFWVLIDCFSKQKYFEK